jgi:hypothetical protein
MVLGHSILSLMPSMVMELPLVIVPLAWMFPATSSFSLGLVVPIPTPPSARIRNWSGPVEVKSASVESPHTKAPLWLALALRPAAKL